MKKLYCVICNKYRKFEKLKIYLLEKTLVLSIICSNMTSDSKTVYIDISDDMANKYNNTYHTIIRIKPAVVKSSTYIESSK